MNKVVKVVPKDELEEDDGGEQARGVANGASEPAAYELPPHSAPPPPPARQAPVQQARPREPAIKKIVVTKSGMRVVTTEDEPAQAVAERELPAQLPAAFDDGHERAPGRASRVHRPDDDDGPRHEAWGEEPAPPAWGGTGGDGAEALARAAAMTGVVPVRVDDLDSPAARVRAGTPPAEEREVQRPAIRSGAEDVLAPPRPHGADPRVVLPSHGASKAGLYLPPAPAEQRPLADITFEVPARPTGALLDGRAETAEAPEPPAADAAHAASYLPAPAAEEPAEAEASGPASLAGLPDLAAGLAAVEAAAQHPYTAVGLDEPYAPFALALSAPAEAAAEHPYTAVGLAPPDLGLVEAAVWTAAPPAPRLLEQRVEAVALAVSQDEADGTAFAAPLPPTAAAEEPLEEVAEAAGEDDGDGLLRAIASIPDPREPGEVPSHVELRAGAEVNVVREEAGPRGRAAWDVPEIREVPVPSNISFTAEDDEAALDADDALADVAAGLDGPPRVAFHVPEAEWGGEDELAAEPADELDAAI